MDFGFHGKKGGISPGAPCSAGRSC
jgi:hypothetical protein